jgi:hypothetical protein
MYHEMGGFTESLFPSPESEAAELERRRALRFRP